MTGIYLIPEPVFKTQNLSLELFYFLCKYVNLQMFSDFSSIILLYKDFFFNLMGQKIILKLPET